MTARSLFLYVFNKETLVDAILNNIFEDEAVIGVMPHCSMEFAELICEPSHDRGRIRDFWEFDQSFGQHEFKGFFERLLQRSELTIITPTFALYLFFLLKVRLEDGLSFCLEDFSLCVAPWFWPFLLSFVVSSAANSRSLPEVSAE